jgi:hypothetical protein
MDPTNINTSTGSSTNKDGEIDQWLDSALRQYAKSAPRAGLEARVLANLRAEHTLSAQRTRWWWRFGTAAAFAAIVIGIWIGEGNRQKSATKMAVIATAPREETRRQEIQGEPQAKVVTRISPSRPERTTRNARANDIHPNLGSASQPKLEQFPSRRNWSEEESLLVLRLNKQPSEAALFEATPTRAEVDLSIGSLEIRPIQIPDIEISESNTN